MRHELFFQLALTGLVSLALAYCPAPAFAAGKSEINYSVDGKAAMAACFDHLAGKPPTTALTQFGFEITNSNKRVTQFKKNTDGGLLPTYLILALAKKPKDPTYLRCTFLLSLPKRLLSEVNSPEFYDFMMALRSQFESKGNRQGVEKGKFGQEYEVWIGPKGTYRLDMSSQPPLIGVDITLN